VGALAGMALFLLLVAPAGASSVREASPPPRDTVIERPSLGSARISASASIARYAVNDGSGATVAISVTPACQVSCTAADPQSIANFLGTLVHGPEMELLTVQLDTPSQLGFDCGFGAQACYYGSEGKVVISGNDGLAPDGASREFVLAHEYGHHLARHRESAPPFPPAIDWGTPHWSSYEDVCRRSRGGGLLPGYEGLHYFRDPGEAFAEAFAFNRFPDSGVEWRWPAALEPDRGTFEAIRLDALRPWRTRTAFRLEGRVPSRRGGIEAMAFRTPLDGIVSLRPSGRRRYDLRLTNRAGRVLRTARHGRGRGGPLNFTVCGQSRLRVAVQATGRRGGPFELQIQRP